MKLFWHVCLTVVSAPVAMSFPTKLHTSNRGQLESPIMLSPTAPAFVQVDLVTATVKSCLATAIALGAASPALQPILLAAIADLPKTFAVLAKPALLSTSPSGHSSPRSFAPSDASTRRPCHKDGPVIFDLFACDSFESPRSEPTMFVVPSKEVDDILELPKSESTMFAVPPEELNDIDELPKSEPTAVLLPPKECDDMVELPKYESNMLAMPPKELSDLKDVPKSESTAMPPKETDDISAVMRLSKKQKKQLKTKLIDPMAPIVHPSTVAPRMPPRVVDAHRLQPRDLVHFKAGDLLRVVDPFLSADFDSFQLHAGDILAFSQRDGDGDIQVLVSRHTVTSTRICVFQVDVSKLVRYYPS